LNTTLEYKELTYSGTCLVHVFTSMQEVAVLPMVLRSLFLEWVIGTVK